MKKSNYYIAFIYGKESKILINTVSGAFIVLKNDEYERFVSGLSYPDEMNILIKNGFLVSDSLIEQEKIDELRYLSMESNRFPHYRVLPTTGCNARCGYCFENGISRERMSDEVAENVIQFIENRTPDNDRVSVTWFGGEPLLEANLISRMTDKLDAVFQRKGNTVSYGLVTNGSLITKELGKIIKQRWHINSLQLTLDGFGDDYDRIKNFYNPNKFNFQKTIESINILIENDVHVSLRLNYTGDNYDSIVRLIDYIYETFGDGSGSLQGKIRPYVHPVWNPQPNQGRYSYYQSNKSDDKFLSLCKMLIEKGDLTYKQMMDLGVRTRRCAACTSNSFSIMPNGNLIKCCESFKHVVGNVFNGVYNFDVNNTWISPKLEKECVDCKLLPMCQGGCKAGFYSQIPRCIMDMSALEKIAIMYADSLHNKQ